MSSTNEVRITDPNTGGQKGSKDQRFDLVPWDAITLLSEHLNKGAVKYAARNWEKGYSYSLSFAALMRHLTAWYQLGEDVDEETRSHHLQAVMFHSVVLMTFVHRGIGTDDRPSTIAANNKSWEDMTADTPAVLDWRETRAVINDQAEQALGLEPGTLLLSVQQ